jgi:LysM repeat protein
MRQDVHALRRELRPREWVQRLCVGRRVMRRWGSVVVVAAIVASLVTGALWPARTQASLTNVLYNGGFEQGFSSQGGCGAVGSGWQCFTNGGAANYGFYDDEWERVVSEGRHSQLIEMNTKGIMVGDADRYAGIYQTVPVVSWGDYALSLKGIIRTTSQAGDPWRYRVQVGWSFGAYPDWTQVTNWQDVGWDKYYPRMEPGNFSSFLTQFRAEAEYVTVYIRVWKKWGVPNEELNVNFDAISLVGPSGQWQGMQPPDGGHDAPPVEQPVHPIYPPVEQPVHPIYPPVEQPVHPIYPPVEQPVHPIYPPVEQPVHPIYPLPEGACVGANLVYNGDFEGGFNAVAVGKVGNSWGYFTNGGGANYGFYDDEWYRVRSDGAHSQLIEINTKNMFPVDNDRYAGIYQYITGLQPGVSYAFTMYGLLRGEGNEDDPYRFAAQWGYAPGYNATWQAVTNWTEMNFGPISKRTDPAALVKYTAKFVAQTSDITLYIRGWKKWGIPNVEMDFNLDGVMVTACGGHGGPVQPIEPPLEDGCWSAPDCGAVWPQPPIAQPPVEWPGGGCGSAPECGGGCGSAPECGGGTWPGGGCTVVVQPGDTLASIAWQMGVSLHELIAVNNIHNPDLIFVGQSLTLPGCGGQATPYSEPVAPVPPASGGVYTVQPGDTLSQIAAWYGVSVTLLCEVNGLWDPNMIFVGQVLIIP